MLTISKIRSLRALEAGLRAYRDLGFEPSDVSSPYAGLENLHLDIKWRTWFRSCTPELIETLLDHTGVT